MVETLVMQHGLSPEDLLGFHQIQAELDSLEAIDDACSESERWWTEATTVFAECVTLVASIVKVEFKHYLIKKG
jgi:hypothetical protein